MTLQEEGSIHYDRKDKDAVSSSREKTLKAEVSTLSSLSIVLTPHFTTGCGSVHYDKKK